MKTCSFPIKAIEHIPGWTADQALVVTSFVVSLLPTPKPKFLELGVYKGRFLSYVSAILPPDSMVVGVDAMYEKNLVFLQESDAISVQNEIVSHVQQVSGKSPKIIIGLSDDFFNSNVDIFDLIHIDASHESDKVMCDVSNSSRSLSEVGILILDDLFNGALPGVTEGFFAANQAEKLEISAFAYAGNKTYFCRPAFHEKYFKGLQELTLKYETEFKCIQGTSKRREENFQNNFEPRLFGFPVNVFLE